MRVPSIKKLQSAGITSYMNYAHEADTKKEFLNIETKYAHEHNTNTYTIKLSHSHDSIRNISLVLPLVKDVVYENIIKHVSIVANGYILDRSNSAAEIMATNSVLKKSIQDGDKSVIIPLPLFIDSLPARLLYNSKIFIILELNHYFVENDIRLVADTAKELEWERREPLFYLTIIRRDIKVEWCINRFTDIRLPNRYNNIFMLYMHVSQPSKLKSTEFWLEGFGRLNVNKMNEHLYLIPVFETCPDEYGSKYGMFIKKKYKGKGKERGKEIFSHYFANLAYNIGVKIEIDTETNHNYNNNDNIDVFVTVGSFEYNVMWIQDGLMARQYEY